MKEKIKVGDYVRRIDRYHTLAWPYGDKELRVVKMTQTNLTFEDGVPWDTDYFELTHVSATIEEKIALAESLMGKQLLYPNIDEGEARTWKIIRRGEPSSRVIEKIANRDGYCVCVQFHGRPWYPVELVEITPEFTEITLPSNYTAKVYDDRVEFPNLTLSKADIAKLYKALCDK